MASHSCWPWNWAMVLLLAFFLLPVILLTLASRLLAPKSKITIDNRKRRWILPIISIPLLLSASILALSDPDSSSPNDAALASEVENLKLKIATLESILDENSNTLSSRVLHLEENNELIEEMEHKIQNLENSLSHVKTSGGISSDSETMVRALEEEVRLLWAELRENNFNYHVLESKANEEKKKVEAVTSKIAMMENIVTERWIQIRQLEQSLQMMKIMTSKVQKTNASNFPKKESIRSTVLKFINGLRHHYHAKVADLPDSFFLGNYISKSIPRASNQLRKVWLTVKNWHYELQDSVRWAMEMNEFTAPLANKELVFFAASSIVIIPVMSAWLLLSLILQLAGYDLI